MERPLIIGTALCALALGGVSLYARSLPATTYVIDGDTIQQGERIYRLRGIDAPELGQVEGHASRQALANLLMGKSVRCNDEGRDSYGRILAHCWAGGQDIAEYQVITGNAIAYRRYSMEYVQHEAEARNAKRGLWANPFFMEPEKWRRRYSTTKMID